MHTVLYSHTHSYNWRGRAETHVHYIAYPGGTELRKNQLIPWHLHRKNIAEHVSRGQGYVHVAKPRSWHSCSYTPKAQARIVIWGTVFYIIATTPVVSKRKGKIQTPCYPHLQLPSRPQEAYWWQHPGPCLHHQDQSTQGKRRSPHCKDLWQV